MPETLGQRRTHHKNDNMQPCVRSTTGQELSPPPCAGLTPPRAPGAKNPRDIYSVDYPRHRSHPPSSAPPSLGRSTTCVAPVGYRAQPARSRQIHRPIFVSSTYLIVRWHGRRDTVVGRCLGRAVFSFVLPRRRHSLDAGVELHPLLEKSGVKTGEGFSREPRNELDMSLGSLRGVNSGLEKEDNTSTL